MVFSPPLTDEQLIEAVTIAKEHGTGLKAARLAGLTSGTTFKNRLRMAAERGLMGPPGVEVLPGFAIKSIATPQYDGSWVKQVKEAGEEFEVPAGHSIKGVSALVDPDGRTIQQWIKTKEGILDPLSLAEYLKTSFADFEPSAKSVAPPVNAAAELLTLLPCGDWHIGMFAWHKEVGADWDLKIAEDTIGAAVEDTVARSPSSEECIILSGGDLLHADNSNNTTAKSGNPLQVDGRYQKVIGVAARLMVRTTDAALKRHRRVTLRILPGNHDEHSAVAIAYFLLAWYRNEPRVLVDVDPSMFFWRRFGLVMLGATHGHTVKIGQMPVIMASRRAEDWGATKFRYVHGFHLHHSAKTATEGNGVVCEIHQAPIPQDAWHHNSGYLSGRSLQAITYHGSYGEIGRVRTAILDAA